MWVVLNFTGELWQVIFKKERQISFWILFLVHAEISLLSDDQVPFYCGLTRLKSKKRWVVILKSVFKTNLMHIACTLKRTYLNFFLKMLLYSYILFFCQQLSVIYSGGKCHSVLQMGIPRCVEEKVFSLMPIRRAVSSVIARPKSVLSMWNALLGFCAVSVKMSS